MLKSIILCIGSNDGETIAGTHMGDTKVFHIFELGAGGKSKFVDKRENTALSMEHAKAEKMKAILGILKDVDVLVARQKSPNFINIARKTKFQPVVVGAAGKFEEVLAALRESFDSITALVEKRRSGERPETFQCPPAA